MRCSGTCTTALKRDPEAIHPMLFHRLAGYSLTRRFGGHSILVGRNIADLLPWVGCLLANTVDMLWCHIVDGRCHMSAYPVFWTACMGRYLERECTWISHKGECGEYRRYGLRIS